MIAADREIIQQDIAARTPSDRHVALSHYYLVDDDTIKSDYQFWHYFTLKSCATLV
jgi:hypothetical protein